MLFICVNGLNKCNWQTIGRLYYWNCVHFWMFIQQIPIKSLNKFNQEYFEEQATIFFSYTSSWPSTKWEEVTVHNAVIFQVLPPIRIEGRDIVLEKGGHIMCDFDAVSDIPTSWYFKSLVNITNMLWTESCIPSK